MQRCTFLLKRREVNLSNTLGMEVESTSILNYSKNKGENNSKYIIHKSMYFYVLVWYNVDKKGKRSIWQRKKRLYKNPYE